MAGLEGLHESRASESIPGAGCQSVGANRKAKLFDAAGLRGVKTNGLSAAVFTFAVLWSVDAVRCNQLVAQVDRCVSACCACGSADFACGHIHTNEVSRGSRMILPFGKTIDKIYW